MPHSFGYEVTKPESFLLVAMVAMALAMAAAAAAERLQQDRPAVMLAVTVVGMGHGLRLHNTRLQQV